MMKELIVSISFRVDDTNYVWEPGEHLLEVVSVEERETKYGRALQWTFCEPGSSEHRTTGMTPVRFAPGTKSITWYLAAKGCDLEDLRNRDLDIADAAGCRVIGVIEQKDGDNGPRFFVTDLRPAPEEAASAAEGAEDDIPF
jgi:hypothetical protein